MENKLRLFLNCLVREERKGGRFKCLLEEISWIKFDGRYDGLIDGMLLKFRIW